MDTNMKDCEQAPSFVCDARKQKTNQHELLNKRMHRDIVLVYQINCLVK